MQTITTESEFALLLKAAHAIVFIDFAWSGQARFSAAVVNEWERTAPNWNLNCPVSRVCPDDLPSVASWMKVQGSKLQSEGGYGSLVWLRSGVIVDYEPYVLAAGLREISRRTQTAFGRKDRLGATLPGLWDRELDD